MKKTFVLVACVAMIAFGCGTDQNEGGDTAGDTTTTTGMADEGTDMGTGTEGTTGNDYGTDTQGNEDAGATGTGGTDTVTGGAGTGTGGTGTGSGTSGGGTTTGGGR